MPSFGAFGIDIFFVISGFILSVSVLREHAQPGWQPTWEFLKRRFIRIYPIYWFVAFVTMARLARSRELFQHSYLAAFFLVPPLHPANSEGIFAYSWTLNFEVFFYLLLGLVLFVTIKRAVPTLIAILLSLCALGAIVGIQHPVINLAANPMLLEFVFGAGIALLYARIGRKRALGFCLTLLGIAASLYVRAQSLPNVANGGQMIMRDQGAFGRVGTWGICAALLVGGLVFWSPSMNSLLGKWWVVLGNASYSCYLVSALALEYEGRIFFKFDPPTPSAAYRILFVFTTVVGVMIVGFFCYILVEKPMLRRLQRILLLKAPSRIPVRNTQQVVHPDRDPAGDRGEGSIAS